MVRAVPLCGAVLFTAHVHFCCLMRALLGRYFYPRFRRREDSSERLHLPEVLPVGKGDLGFCLQTFLQIQFSVIIMRRNVAKRRRKGMIVSSKRGERSVLNR